MNYLFCFLHYCVSCFFLLSVQFYPVEWPVFHFHFVIYFLWIQLCWNILASYFFSHLIWSFYTSRLWYLLIPLFLQVYDHYLLNLLITGTSFTIHLCVVTIMKSIPVPFEILHPFSILFFLKNMLMIYNHSDAIHWQAYFLFLFSLETKSFCELYIVFPLFSFCFKVSHDNCIFRSLHVYESK